MSVFGVLERAFQRGDFQIRDRGRAVRGFGQETTSGIERMAGISEIRSDGRAVWINAPDGSCIGRFGRLGVDVHRSATAQLNGEPECLVCTHGTVSQEDWILFVAAMAEHHDVLVDERHRPRYLAASCDPAAALPYRELAR